MTHTAPKENVARLALSLRLAIPDHDRSEFPRQKDRAGDHDAVVRAGELASSPPCVFGCRVDRNVILAEHSQSFGDRSADRPSGGCFDNVPDESSQSPAPARPGSRESVCRMTRTTRDAVSRRLGNLNSASRRVPASTPRCERNREPPPGGARATPWRRPSDVVHARRRPPRSRMGMPASCNRSTAATVAAAFAP